MGAAAPGFSVTGRLPDPQEGLLIRLAFDHNAVAALATRAGVSDCYRIQSGALPGVGQTINLAGTEDSLPLAVHDRIFFSSGRDLMCMMVVGGGNVSERKIAASWGPDDATVLPAGEFHQLQHVNARFSFGSQQSSFGRDNVPESCHALAERAGVPEEFLLDPSIMVPAAGGDLELRGKYFPVVFTVYDVRWYTSDQGALCALVLMEKMISVSHLPMATTQRLLSRSHPNSK